MIAPLPIVRDDPDVLSAVRELLSNRPEIAYYGAETIAGLLHARCFLAISPVVFEVEAALEALQIDSEELVA